MSAQNPIVFFSRCKPYSTIDVLDIARKEKRIFFGYAPRKTSAQQPPSQFLDSKCLKEDYVNIAGFETSEELKKKKDNILEYSDSIATNHGFVHGENSVTDGSIAIIPRPNMGCFYAGYVKGGFRFECDQASKWMKDFLKEEFKSEDNAEACIKKYKLEQHDKKSKGVNTYNVLPAELLQCWEVDNFTPIPFYAMPKWIVASTMSRSTMGRISHEGAYESIEKLIEKIRKNESPRPPSERTNEDEEIQKRLYDQISPSTFEHLCVALLQLKNPDQCWQHVGGCGDGGVDGLGFDSNGKLIGKLQCKRQTTNNEIKKLIKEEEEEEEEEKEKEGKKERKNTKYIIATLSDVSADVASNPNAEIWNRKKIADLFKKHAAHLPWANTLRIEQTKE